MINSMVIAQCLYIYYNDGTTASRFKSITHAHIWHKQTTLCKVSDKWRVWYILICNKHVNDITIDGTPKKRLTTIQLSYTDDTIRQ